MPRRQRNAEMHETHARSAPEQRQDANPKQQETACRNSLLVTDADERLLAFMEKAFDGGAIRTAGVQHSTVAEYDGELALKERLHLPDMSRVHDARAMNTKKRAWVKCVLKFR